MKIFTYASYNPEVSTLKYIADAAGYYTGCKIRVPESLLLINDDEVLNVYYMDDIPIIDNRNLIISDNTSVKNFTRTGRVYVSVAHTDSYLVIALSDKIVGIDIEQTKPRKNYRCIAKKIGVECSDEKEFYKLWTRYESRIKANGIMNAYCKAYNTLGALNINILDVNYYDIFPNTVTAVTGMGCAEFVPMETMYKNIDLLSAVINNQ